MSLPLRPTPAPPRGETASLLRVAQPPSAATSDTAEGGSAKEPRPYWEGLAAVWAKELTRRSLFEALQARRTYALTRARIVLRMTVNGAPMGSELPESEKAEIRIDVCACAPIRKV